MLNRNQVAFALTLSRNTDQVVDFKFDLIIAFDLVTNPKPLYATSSRLQLTGEEEQTLILCYVERLQYPTARDLSRYLKRYPVASLRQMLHAYAEQGMLLEWKSARSWRYKVKPQRKLIEVTASH